MVFYQPDPSAAPAFMGFVSTDPQIGAYFGHNIFVGTPIENAPASRCVGCRVTIEGFEIETMLSELEPRELVERPFGAPLPFVQQGIEAAANQISLRLNGEDIPVDFIPVGLSGGACAVWSPAGVYSLTLNRKSASYWRDQGGAVRKQPFPMA